MLRGGGGGGGQGGGGRGGGVCSLAKCSVAYEETQSNQVSDFRDSVFFVSKGNPFGLLFPTEKNVLLTQIGKCC